MCIEKKIAQLEEKIAQLKKLQQGVLPVKFAFAALFEDFASEAPEELPEVWQEFLAIGSQYNLVVQPLAADELRQWEAANAENERLKAELEELKQKFAKSSASWPTKYPELYNPQNSSFKQQVPTVRDEEHIAPELDNLNQETQTDTIQGILGSKGFYEPDVNLGDVYDPEDKQDNYSGWDIYCSVHDSGQAMSIGLSNERLGQFWDVCTEFLADHDPSFPKSLSEKQPILTWVRSVIDSIPASTIVAPKQDLETPGQLSLQFGDDVLTGKEYDDAVEEKLALDEENIPELGGNWAEDLNEEAAQEPKELRTITIKTKDKKWEDVQITDNSNTTGYVSFLFQTANRQEGFTHRVTVQQLLECPGTWGEHVERILQEKVTPEESIESNLIKEFSITNLLLPHQEIRARVTPAIGNGKFAGATFTFYRGTETEELFTTTQTADEIAKGENNPELIAVALAKSWLKRQELKNSSPAGTTHTESRPKDDFTELVYVSDAVAYLKRKDNGEILAGYLGFSNKTPEGDRAPTMAKSRAAKWQEHLVGVYQLHCSEPRECQRIHSKNPKQPFKYELKIVQPTMGKLQMLSAEDFGLYPNEIAGAETVGEKKPSQISTKTPIVFSDFELERVADFDDLNPEFSVNYKGVFLTRIWSSLRTTAGQQPQRLWRHKLLKPGEEIELKDTEEAVFHALQRIRGLA